eukprot:7831930-Pyramimonas_sp.AAC.1
MTKSRHPVDDPASLYPRMHPLHDRPDGPTYLTRNKRVLEIPGDGLSGIPGGHYSEHFGLGRSFSDAHELPLHTVRCVDWSVVRIYPRLLRLIGPS